MQPRMSVPGPGGIESHTGSGSQQLHCITGGGSSEALGAGSSSRGVGVARAGSGGRQRLWDWETSKKAFLAKCWGPEKRVAVTLRTVGSGC